MNQATHDLMEPAASDPHHFAVRQLGDFPNEAVLLVHRGADGQAEWHETQVDVIYVQSGSATLLVGGTLVNGETVAPHEKRNGTIQGGFRQKVTTGDWIRIPPPIEKMVFRKTNLHLGCARHLQTARPVTTPEFAGVPAEVAT